MTTRPMTYDRQINRSDIRIELIRRTSLREIIRRVRKAGYRSPIRKADTSRSQAHAERLAEYNAEQSLY